MAMTGFGAMYAQLNAIEKKWRDGLGTAIELAALTACEEARALAPVDTGALMRSINVQTEALSAVVSANVPYAAYVELGTGSSAAVRGNPAQPFLRPAFELGKVDLLRRVSEVIK